jgi:2-iminobutanoate/2-iminopropanoate deaminase
MQRRDLNASDAPQPVAAYTQAIEVTGATRTLYISGQIGQRMDGTIPADIVEQSRLAWQNLEAQLKAAGMTLDNLVKVRRPASTLIVGGLANPDWKIEVEGIAAATTILPNHGDVAAARAARSAVLGDREGATSPLYLSGARVNGGIAAHDPRSGPPGTAAGVRIARAGGESNRKGHGRHWRCSQ